MFVYVVCETISRRVSTGNFGCALLLLAWCSQGFSESLDSGRTADKNLRNARIDSVSGRTARFLDFHTRSVRNKRRKILHDDHFIFVLKSFRWSVRCRLAHPLSVLSYFNKLYKTPRRLVTRRHAGSRSAFKMKNCESSSLLIGKICPSAWPF
jgi:hypothetical protein